MVDRSRIDAAKQFLLQQEATQQNAQPNRERIDAAKAYLLTQMQQPEPQPEPDFTAGDRAAQIGHGSATGTAGLLDLISKAGQYAYKMPMALSAQMNEKPLRTQNKELTALREQKRLEALAEIERAPESNLREITSRLLSEAYGKELEPAENDTVGKFAHGFGEFMAPVPGSGYVKAAKMASKGIPAVTSAIGKVLEKEARMAAGATVLTQTPQIAEEGSGLGILENMAKGVTGSIIGANPLQTAKSIAKIPGNVVEGFANIPAKLLSLGTKINEEVFKLAEKHGVELPFNVGMRGVGGSAQNFLANNVLNKTYTSSQKYKDMLQRANESMINAVKKNIDSLGEANIKPAEASADYRKFLQNQEKVAEETSRALYDKATTFLTPADKVIPKHTLSSIESMRELVSRDIKSPATKKVVKILGDLSESWGINPQELGFKDHKAFQAALKNDPKMGAIILDALNKNPRAIPIERLNGVRKELGTITGHDPDIKGVEAYLNKLKSDITKDIESSGNKEFVGAWREANKFFKDSVAGRFRTDMARSIMTGEMPKDAFNLMSSAKTIRELERIAGESIASREVFDALKKAKVREIFSNTLKEGEGQLSVGNFINLFKKEKGQEVLQALLPPQSYNNMVEISKIAKEYQKSGRDLLNTSGTAWVTADLGRLNKVEDLIKNSLLALLGGTAVVNPGAAAGAAISLATPNLISRLVANPRIVEKARAYATARIRGNEKQADILMSQLMKMSQSDAKAALIAADKSIESKENKERKK